MKHQPRPVPGVPRPEATSSLLIRSNRRFGWTAAAIFLVALTVRLLHVWQIRKAPFFTVLEEALAEFRAALNVNPASVAAHNNLGIALGKRGRLDEAIDQFQQALRIQPGFADAQRNLATVQDLRHRSR